MPKHGREHRKRDTAPLLGKWPIFGPDAALEITVCARRITESKSPLAVSGA
jgi:hypothetical protein